MLPLKPTQILSCHPFEVYITFISPSCLSTFSFSAGELIHDGAGYKCIYAFDHWTTWPEVYFNLLLGNGWDKISLHISVCPCILCVARTIILNTWITSMSHHTLPNHIISFIFCAFSFKLSKPYPYPLSCWLCACLFVFVCVFYNIEEAEECFVTAFCLCLYFFVSIFICFCLSASICLCSLFQYSFYLVLSSPLISKFLLR